MKILFISSNLIGDSILSTGILSSIKEENINSKITLVTGPTSNQLFDSFPNIEKIIIIKKMKLNFHWMILWLKLINNKWDLIIDLRSSAISYFLFTKKRKIFKRNNKPITQVEKLSNFMNYNEIKKPKIYINNLDKNSSNLIIKNKYVIAISPGGNWEPKIWPSLSYNNLIKKIISMYPEKKIYFLIVGSNLEYTKYFNDITKGIEKETFINIMGKSLSLTFGCLEKSKLFIGNDSGLMHLAAASGISTIGLFGPTRDDWYRPYGENCYVIRTKENFKQLRKDNNNFNSTLMNSIEVSDITNLILTKKLIQ